MINERAVALGGATEESAAGVARWFAMPLLDPAQDMRLAVDDARRRGRLRGRVRAGGRHPEGLDRPAGAERQRRRAGAALRVGPGTWGRARRPGRQAPVLRRRARRGASRAAHRCRLRASCDPPTRWNARSAGDLDAARLAGRSSRSVRSPSATQRPSMPPPTRHSADHWGYVPTTFEAWRAQNLGRLRGQLPLAGRLGRQTRSPGSASTGPRTARTKSVGWVGDLAVRRPWRRRGLGEALLRDSFTLFRRGGKRSAGLGVDAENTTGAVALYERVGMHVVRRSNTWERTA